MVITIADDLVAFGQVRQVAPQYRRTSTRARTSFLTQSGGPPHPRDTSGPDASLACEATPSAILGVGIPRHPVAVRPERVRPKRGSGERAT